MIDRAIHLADTQLTDLEMASGGELEVLSRPNEPDERSFVISIATGINDVGDGIRIRSRERFRIAVSERFPYAPPSVLVEHRRWAGSWHVQWGTLLCLYAAPSVEWIPADGMRGLLERLLNWLARAAEGKLDPDGQPLHPPVAYPTATGLLIVRPNLGDRVPWSSESGRRVVLQFGWCIRDGDRIEVLNWLTEKQVFDRATLPGGRPKNSQGNRYFISLTVLIVDELGWEYPSEGKQLVEALARAGYTREDLLVDLTWISRVNRVLRARDVTTEGNDDPVIVLLGTPARRDASGEQLAHLVAWKLDQFGNEVTALLADGPLRFTQKTINRLLDAARGWLRTVKVEWMPVYDQRPEITQRRDQGTPVSWLRDTRVLVLGCGALGAPVSECCVRAGARSVTLLDNGTVTPGILVRQPYRDSDIGYAKADALANHLNAITRKPAAHPNARDAILFLLDAFDPSAFDLIVDATANSGVRAAIERAHCTHMTSGVPWPPTVTMIIGHRADLGLVTISRSGATGTGYDILRRVMLRARGTRKPEWQDIVADFFPDPPRVDAFFPEPGCSAPTFIGSAADVTALAAAAFTEAIRIVSAQCSDAQAMTAIAIRQPRVTSGRHQAASESLTWLSDTMLTDSATGYNIRISAEAVSAMRAEVRRCARVHGERIETGGMLLGSLDESTGIVSVDLATGPSPDSKLSSNYFHHGTAGTQDLINHHVRETGGIVGFLGIWHTHPYGSATPSQIDRDGMMSLTTSMSTLSTALMVILGGTSKVWRTWIEESGLPEFYAQIVEHEKTIMTDTWRNSHSSQPIPYGHYVLGGYATPPIQPSTLPRRWWSWWRK